MNCAGAHHGTLTPPGNARSCVQEYHCGLTGSWREQLAKAVLAWVGIALHLIWPSFDAEMLRTGGLRALGLTLAPSAKAYRKKSWKAIHQTQRRSYVKRKQNHQGSYTARRAAAIRPIMNSTQGIATLLPSALYRALSEASGMSVQPSGKPCRRSHSNGVRRRMR